MSILLVAYDLNNPGQNHSKVLEVVKNYNWAKLSESSYAIETIESPQALYKNFSPFLDNNDQLIVITLSSPWYGLAQQDVASWLKNHI